MNVEKIIDSLSPNERKIIPFIEEENIVEICKKSNLDNVAVLRALEYLQNKKIVALSYEKIKILQLGLNGLLYKKKGLPERKLLNVLSDKRIIHFKDAPKLAKLSKEEFKAAIGALKNKAFIEIKGGKIFLESNNHELAKKFPEELLIEKLPLNLENLSDEQKFAFDNLKKRKEIVEIREKTKIGIKVSDLGKKIISSSIKKEDYIENININLLKKDSFWKGKKFRRYDVSSSVPGIYGGKRHFVNQAGDYARSIWSEMGFEEMKGNLIQSSFWNFDALFTAQDHPVREMQDTFFIDKKIELPNRKIVEDVKNSHEKGVEGSKGWKYNWDYDDARKAVLRTHTTCLSAQKLYELSELPPEKRIGKFFSVGVVFRNETIDWKHGFEFNQTEGIVVGKDVNLRYLMGYLKEFYKKMGFEKIRFSPGFFPYTEPSMEINVWHPVKKEWLEIGGSGIFRPEVTEPLIGKDVKVLAWGLGFDRIITDFYKIKDLRELYKNNLTQLRKMKFWIK